MDSQKYAFPLLIHEIPLHVVRVGVWCAVSATRILGKIFISYTHSDTFPNTCSITREHVQYFQQEPATAYCMFECITFYLSKDRSVTAQYIIWLKVGTSQHVLHWTVYIRSFSVRALRVACAFPLNIPHNWKASFGLAIFWDHEFWPICYILTQFVT